MNKITELKDAIRDIGERVLELESGLHLRELVNKGEISPKGLFKYINHIYKLALDFTRLNERECRKNKDLKIPFPEAIMDSEDYNSYLALTVPGHDLPNFACSLAGRSMSAQDKMEKGKQVELKHEIQDHHYLMYENLRLGLHFIPYVATGYKKFLTNVEITDLPDLLRNITHKRTYSFNFDAFERVDSDIYFGIVQLAKNAKKSLARARHEYNDDVRTIDVRFTHRIPYNIFVVEENGDGIPKDKLPELFGSYTTGGTGIGLQLVKRVADLREGHVKAVSTFNGYQTYSYDTKSNRTEKIDQKLRGTAFKIYTAK